MRKMSASVEQRSEGTLPTSFPTSDDALSELGDGSSSLSEIEDKEAEPEDVDGIASENDVESDVNDSEAETERLENSPHNQRKLKDVVLSSQAESSTYERSPSKLQQQLHAEINHDDDHEADELSDDDASVDKSTKSVGVAEQDPITTATSLEDSSGEGKGVPTTHDSGGKKRKRSLIPDQGSVDDNEVEEPARKRTGSVGAVAQNYAIDDSASVNGDAEASNPISDNISDAESLDAEDGEEEETLQQTDEKTGANSGVSDTTNTIEASRSEVENKKSRKRRRSPGNNVDGGEADEVIDVNAESVQHRDSQELGDVEEQEDAADLEGEEADAALKNEEEQERKRVAMDQLGDIERHFTSFKDRLYDVRLAQLDAEEAMLRQDKSTHPEYLAMLKCVDERRDEKLRIEARLTQLRLETIQRSAVGKRSQILSQFYQEVRDIRESKLEMLGKQWYEIQHERRGYGANVEDYALKFPARKSQQVMHQLAYNTEVSLLSGIAKYVGFPAAPPMASATTAESDHDFEKINKSIAKQQSQRGQQSLLLPELAALRAATSTTGFKPAEEQFIEQTPWANPQHPSHAHALQHQSLGHQPGRISSPFSSIPTAQVRKNSHQHVLGTPLSGTFSGAAQIGQPNTNGSYLAGGRVSPMNSLLTTSLPQKVAPSPLASRQTSLSPQQVKPLTGQLLRQESFQDYSADGNSNHLPVRNADIQETVPEQSKEADVHVERDLSVTINGHQ